MNIVHLIVVKNSFYILESGRTIQKFSSFSLILGTKNLAEYWDSTGMSMSLMNMTIWIWIWLYVTALYRTSVLMSAMYMTAISELDCFNVCIVQERMSWTLTLMTEVNSEHVCNLYDCSSSYFNTLDFSFWYYNVLDGSLHCCSVLDCGALHWTLLLNCSDLLKIWSGQLIH